MNKPAHPSGFKKRDTPLINGDASRLISRDETFLRQVQQQTYQNLSNPHFGVRELAEAVHLSVSQLNRKLNAIGEQTAGKLIKATRLNRAAQMLANDTGSIGEIANQAGFTNQANFCRSFKKAYACTPSSFRRKYSKPAKGPNSR